MRYLVCGTDTTSGARRDVIVDASNVAHACQLAGQQGLTVLGAVPYSEEMSGIALIGLSVPIFIASLVCLVVYPDHTWLRLVAAAGLFVAGIFHLAGVIRWAVSGSRNWQVEMLLIQHRRVLELLERREQASPSP